MADYQLSVYSLVLSARLDPPLYLSYFRLQPDNCWHAHTCEPTYEPVADEEMDSSQPAPYPIEYASKTLIIGVSLSIDNTTHAQTSREVSIAEAVASLPIPDSISHGHSSPSIALELDLAMNNTSHTHSSSTPTVQQASLLVVNPTTHTTMSTCPGLVELFAINPNDASHIHTSALVGALVES